MVVPPPGYNPVPARPSAEHRAYKKKLAQELYDKVLAEKDPIRRDALERELAKRHPTHYDIKAQPGWPLHDWPYKGVPLSKEMIPKSHFIAKAHLPPEDWCYAERPYTIDKHLAMVKNAGRHMKMNPRRRFWAFMYCIAFPSAIAYNFHYIVRRREQTMGRLPGDYNLFKILSRRMAHMVE